MKQCPTCKGKGTQNIQSRTYGSSVVEHQVITCLDCKGVKKLTQEQYKSWEKMQAYARAVKEGRIKE